MGEAERCTGNDKRKQMLLDIVRQYNQAARYRAFKKAR
jgi:hypothetical protein